MELVKGGKYNWKGQPERLIYLGCNWSGNGYWHQFAKVEEPEVVWCECLESDLVGIEETPKPIIEKELYTTYDEALAWGQPWFTITAYYFNEEDFKQYADEGDIYDPQNPPIATIKLMVNDGDDGELRITLDKFDTDMIQFGEGDNWLEFSDIGYVTSALIAACGFRDQLFNEKSPDEPG